MNAQTTKFAVAWAFIVSFFFFFRFFGCVEYVCRLVFVVWCPLPLWWCLLRAACGSALRQVNIRLSHLLLRNFRSRINTFDPSWVCFRNRYAFVTCTCALYVDWNWLLMFIFRIPKKKNAVPNKLMVLVEWMAFRFPWASASRTQSDHKIHSKFEFFWIYLSLLASAESLSGTIECQNSRAADENTPPKHCF